MVFGHVWVAGPKAQVTKTATRGAIVPVEMDVPQQRKVSL